MRNIGVNVNSFNFLGVNSLIQSYLKDHRQFILSGGFSSEESTVPSNISKR